ncbi:MAG: 1,4-alpha-glucan branching enzyme, partial [Clostridia bacterium]|nr:1,4-alpha-glucan branching enzyme [Clostridia bacterium]
VIIDWVPGHFCRDSHGLYRFDGKPLYESDNEKKADNPGWGTCNFDFSRTYVKSFLKSNADYWIEKYHVDGIRADAVANMLSFDFSKQQCNELKNQYGTYENIEAICFLRELNSYIKEKYPHVIMCAEDSSDRGGITAPAEIGGLGFAFKWNLGWMNDTLKYMKHDPIYRKSLHDKMTFCMMYAFNEKFILPLSHDEVVHGKCSMVEKMPGYRVDKFAQLRAYYTYMYGIPGKKLNFMGNEFGQSLEWRFYEQLEWQLLKFKECSSLKNFCSDLNYLYLNEPAFYEKDTGWDGFRWCNAGDADRSVYSFTRFGNKKEDTLIFIINFTPVRYENYEVGVPFFEDYKEIINTDDGVYGGNNLKNRGSIIPEYKQTAEMPYTIKVNLAPFGGMILKYDDKIKKD